MVACITTHCWYPTTKYSPLHSDTCDMDNEHASLTGDLTTPVATGGCLCGKVRYAILGEPTYVYYCHCAMCRKASGSVAGTWLTVKVEDFQIINDVPLSPLKSTPNASRLSPSASSHLRTYRSSDRFVRKFCWHCGSHIYFSRVRGAQHYEICHGSLDEPQLFPPQNHIWTSASLPYLQLDTHLPSWQEEVD